MPALTDARVAGWDLRGTPGTTVTVALTWVDEDGVAINPLAPVSMWVGGTVTDPTDFTGATEYVGVVVANVATCSVVVPTGVSSTPLRVTLDEVLTIIGTLVPDSRGTSSSSLEVTVRSGEVSATIVTSTVVGGGGSDTAAQILAKLLTVDGAGSGLDADLLDGTSSAGFATAAQGAKADAALPLVAAGASVENIGAVESNVQTVGATGSTETLDTSVYGVFDMTMDQSCIFTFSNPAPSGKATTFVLILRGAFTPTLPNSIDWGDATPPTYTTPSVYTFTTVDAGTTWLGAQVGKAYA